MLPWATLKLIETGVPSVLPSVLRRPELPAGMTSVSVLAGMNGASALNDSVLVPTLVHDPITGGVKLGVPDAAVTGNEKWTLTA